jgi:hypothetical protein
VRLRIVFLATISACQSGSIFAQSTSQRIEAVRPMRQLYVQDQRDRGVSLSDSGDELPAGATAKASPNIDDAALQKHDAERRQRVREMLSEGEVTTAQDFHDAAYIFQHGQKPEDPSQKRTHGLSATTLIARDNWKREGNP